MDTLLRQRWALGAAAFLLGALTAGLAARLAAQTEGSRAVALTVEVDSSVYRPNIPNDAWLRMVVTNGSGAPVSVPEAYDGVRVVLYGQGVGHQWPLTWVRLQGSTAAALEPLEPGAQRVIAEASLHTLLAGASAPLAEADSGLVWTWMAHPAPPPSPAHGTHGQGYQSSVALWAELQLEDGGTVRSESVVLTVDLADDVAVGASCATDYDCAGWQVCELGSVVEEPTGCRVRAGFCAADTECTISGTCRDHLCACDCLEDVHCAPGICTDCLCVASEEPLAVPPIGQEFCASGNFPVIHMAFDEVGPAFPGYAQLQLAAIVECLRTNPRPVRIVGHTDERGTDAYNLARGDRSARLIDQMLERLGVAPDLLDTLSQGEGQPVQRATNEQAWTRNRRVEIQLR